VVGPTLPPRNDFRKPRVVSVDAKACKLVLDFAAEKEAQHGNWRIQRF
jgi:hypothetical protein